MWPFYVAAWLSHSIGTVFPGPEYQQRERESVQAPGRRYRLLITYPQKSHRIIFSIGQDSYKDVPTFKGREYRSQTLDEGVATSCHKNIWNGIHFGMTTFFGKYSLPHPPMTSWYPSSPCLQGSPMMRTTSWIQFCSR